MTNTEKEATVKLGGMQAHTRDLFNKGIGSEGTCSTAGDTAAKTVTLGTTFELVSKATILVKFTNAISVANATLAVTHTDLSDTTTTEAAKPIYYRGAALAAGLVKAGDSLILRYDGTSWNILGVLDQNMADTYPDLIAGNVVGEFSDTGAEFSYRPTAGAVDIESGQADYGARLERVKGNTIPMNQYVENGDFATNTGWHAVDGTMSISNNKCVFTANDTSKASSRIYGGQHSQINGHKYLIIVFVKASVSTDMLLAIENTNMISGSGNATGQVNVHANEKTELNFICSAKTSNREHFLLYTNRNNSLQSGDTVEFSNLNCIDLTLIYGEGNEPSTVAEFEADYQKWLGKPLAYEEYDEGSLRNVKMTGIKTVGFNLWDEEWEVGGIDAATGQLVDSNRIRSKKFIPVLPNTTYYITAPQMNGVWIVEYDASFNFIKSDRSENDYQLFTTSSECAYVKFTEVYSTYGTVYKNNINLNLHHSGDKDGEYEQHWESTLNVPITTLKGKLNGQGSSVVVFPDGMKKAGSVYDEIVRRGDKTYAIKRVGSVDLGSLNWTYSVNKQYFYTIFNRNYYTQINMVCPKYITWYNNIASLPDKSICRNYQEVDGIYIKDTSYTDATILKSALQGVILFYELATPQEYLLDDFELPQTYDVDDYGTEEILLGTDGVAPILDLKYGINAGDTIKNLPHNYVSAVGEQNFTEAQKARARKNIGAAEELSEDLKEMPEVTSEALTDIYKTLDGMRENFKHLGECKATCIDSEEIPKVCGGPLVIEGTGAPAAPNVPVFVGQRYHDKTNKKVYEAFSVTNSISDWVLLN